MLHLLPYRNTNLCDISFHFSALQKETKLAAQLDTIVCIIVYTWSSKDSIICWLIKYNGYGFLKNLSR
jgi:hypothetical protein